MHLLNLRLCPRSKYTVVCRAAKKAGALHRVYIDRKNYIDKKKENMIFAHTYIV